MPDLSDSGVRGIPNREGLAYPKEYKQAYRNVRSWKYLPLGVRVFDPTHIGGAQDVIVINRHGFRSQEFIVDEAEEFRVVLLGSSAGWGSGATSNEATVTGQLEEMLNVMCGTGTRRRARCFNLAMPSATSQHELLYFLFWGLRLQPHCVVALSGGNDLGAKLEEPHSVSIMAELVEAWDLVVRHTTEFDLRVRRSLLRRAIASNVRQYARTFYVVSLLDRLRLRIARARGRIPEASVEKSSIVGDQGFAVGEDVFRDQMEFFLHNYKVVHDLCKANDIPFLLFVQPHLYGKRELTAEESYALDYFTNYHGAWMRYRMIAAFHRKYHIFNSYRRLAEARCPELVEVLYDLTDLFSSAPEWLFHSTVHLTDRGYTLVAKAIAREMYRRGIFRQGALAVSDKGWMND